MYAYVPPAPQFTTSTTDVLCNGGSTGTIAISTTQGTPPFTYTINGQATSADITGLAAGDYVIGVTDAFGCSAHDATVTVSEPDLLTVDTDGCGVVYLGAGVDYACATINTTVTGGVAGYTFDWTNTETTEGITVCPDSTSNYEVTVTDANGCTATADWQVQVVDIECSPGHQTRHIHGSGFRINSSHDQLRNRNQDQEWKWIKFNEYAKYGKWT